MMRSVVVGFLYKLKFNCLCEFMCSIYVNSLGFSQNFLQPTMPQRLIVANGSESIFFCLM
jgi:hypothetical protein